MSMHEILEAISAGERTHEAYAALPLPESYRAATVHKDEVGIFEGMATREKDPRKSLHVEQVAVLPDSRFAFDHEADGVAALALLDDHGAGVGAAEP